MKVRVIIQIHPDGQKNVCFTQDPLVDPEDLIVRGNGWEKATIIRDEIILVGDGDTLFHLCDTELRSVDNALDITSCALPDDHVFDIRLLLQNRARQ